MDFRFLIGLGNYAPRFCRQDACAPRFHQLRSLVSCVLCLAFFLCFTFSVAAQEVTVLMTNGDEVTGSLLEYSNEMLKIRTQHGSLKISAKDLVQINFASKAQHHLVNAQQLLELGVNNEAVEEFRAAIRESPRYAEAYYELGRFWEKQGRMDEALEYFSIAINLGLSIPGMADHIMKVADNYRLKDDMERAAETYYLLFQRFPEDQNAEYAVYRAGFIFAELKSNEKALDALRGAVAEFPMSQFVEKGYYELGRIYEVEGSLEAAAHILLPFLSDYPSSEWSDDAHYVLAKVYHRQRRNESAIEELKWVMNESTDAELITAAQQMLDECAWIVYGVSDGLSSEDVHALALDGHYMWVATATGVVQFDLESNSFTGEIGTLKEMDVWALAADEFQLWVGTLNSGIKQYDKTRGMWSTYTKDEGLSSDVASAISIDPDNVWIATASGGVYRYDRYDLNWINYTEKERLAGNETASIASMTDGVWCGTLKNGVSRFDKLTEKWQDVTMPDEGRERSVTSIAVGSNYVWFAWYEELRNGVTGYDVTTKSWKENWPITQWEKDTLAASGASIDVISLGANDKEMWFGTESEVMFYDYATSQLSESFKYPSELTGHVPKCVLVRDDFIWFATSRGLGRLDRKLIERIREIR